ncbi:hypothetical protein BABINDRAFT_37523 [Babjeviella inositovora NRRL Y-12698]|uniref:Aspartate aminotransferase n=1 Tax=Babjeviella inositovora NRRL Y-12698 TaxID=984486 RepID=A0A1E3QP20_9ASCO|nr:uncharacterized protein BABINDRAFT_37523 [Babjeviella inositovora NRRL Y-12698]ODQ79421.1 hypothetical protein BABINDRAFT_37523 [Babjeviella inositovora NRRL Y-12698]
MSSSFANITTLPPDPLFGLSARFKADDRSSKVDLGIGAYRDNSGKPWILPAVKLAEKKLQSDNTYNHEYLPISGHQPFTSAAAKVILGSDSAVIRDDAVVSIQSLSGTGALHVAASFLNKFYTAGENEAARKTIYISNPTWANHVQIFESVGMKTAQYPYWDADTKSLDLKGFLAAIEAAPRGSIFLLHACAHNPTGLDPTQAQWKQIIKAINDRGHLPIFDSAYQGFASGSLEADSWAVRYAIAEQSKTQQPIFICQSFAKNVGMYGERAGVIHVISPDFKNKNAFQAVSTNLQKIIRSELSNPPAYGAKVVATVLNSPELYKQWEQDLVTMSSRISLMRASLKLALDKLEGQTGGNSNWEHIVSQQGMFSFTGLSALQVSRMEKEHAVYLVSSGRISMAGLNEDNVEYVAKAIHEVVGHTYSETRAVI